MNVLKAADPNASADRQNPCCRFETPRCGELVAARA